MYRSAALFECVQSRIRFAGSFIKLRIACANVNVFPVPNGPKQIIYLHFLSGFSCFSMLMATFLETV